MASAGVSLLLRRASSCLGARVHSCRYLRCGHVVARREEWRERYLEMSRLSTEHFQLSLPRLPIPSLRHTITRYLAAQRPLLCNEDYLRTEKLATEFATEGSDGWKVHQQLIERDRRNPHTSYIARFWHDRYMKDRRPSLNLRNPYIVVKQDPRCPNQVDRAVNFIHSAVLFRNSLTDSKLEPDLVYTSRKINPQSLKSFLRFIPRSFATQVALLAGAVPLDISQLGNLFGTTRIPKRGGDELVTSPTSQHVVVMRNGHLYCVEVQQANGLPTNPDQLYSALSAITNDSSPPPPHPVSYLTATDRDTWADARRELITDPQNVDALEKVESALFVVCLDHREPETLQDAFHTFLHNHGANRWFDKSVMVVVSPGAEVSLQFEHSCLDGPAFISFSNRVFFNTIRYPYMPSSTPTSTALPERLQFRLTESLKATVEKAQIKVEHTCRSLTIRIHMYSQFGKTLIRNKHLTVGGTLQLAFQMAYYRQFGQFDSSIQPFSTAAFLHGRTEWVRPGTIAAKACADAFQPSSGASTSEKRRLLNEAVAQHQRLFQEALRGQGFDRHLYALKCLAQEEGLSLSLFEDPAYSQINRYLLYANTFNAKCFSYGAFGPYSSDGFAVGYQIRDESITFNVFGYSTEKVEEFVSNICTVLDDIHEVVVSL